MTSIELGLVSESECHVRYFRTRKRKNKWNDGVVRRFIYESQH